MFNFISKGKPRKRRQSSRERTVARPVWSKEVNSFLDVYGSVMSQTQVPVAAKNKYLRYLKRQLLCRRSAFLVQCRNYPIFGLRLLGGDVSDDRCTTQMFKDVRLVKNADGVLLPVFLGWFWNRLWQLRKVDKPTELQALQVSRILSVLSFSKFLKIDCKCSRISAERKYVERIREMTTQSCNSLTIKFNDPLYLSMNKYLNQFGYTKHGDCYKFDRRCYSLKSLTGKKPFRPSVPPAYGLNNNMTLMGPYDENGRLRPNLLKNVVQPYYYSKEDHDAKLCIIVESGGKYRGICPYRSPYAHSTNLYHEARTVLLRLPGNCNYNQSAGHKKARLMSCDKHTKISADASNFSDTIRSEYWMRMARSLNADRVIYYNSQLRIKIFDGTVITGCLPLMGWKGTFDLASVILAYSAEQVLGPYSKSTRRIQCGDDYLGYGTLAQYKEVYSAIGCKLSEEKTIVSKTVTIFCGKMFWKGFDISASRFLTYGLSLTNKYVGEMISRTRDLVDNKNNFSKATRRAVYGYLKRSLGSRYKGYLDFRLSSNLGGIQLSLSPPQPLLNYLETNWKAFFCAIYNIPNEPIAFDGYTNHFSHLPLGKPYSKMNMDLPLTPGSWPTKRRLSFARIKASRLKLWDSNRIGITDILLYINDGIMLKS